MSGHEVKGLGIPMLNTSTINKKYVDNIFLSLHGGAIVGNISMSGQSITGLNPTPQNNNDAVTNSYVDNSISLAGGLSITGIAMQGDINMSGHNVTGLVDSPRTTWLQAKVTRTVTFWILLVV